MMNISYIIWAEDDGYVIRAVGYPVTTQGQTKLEAIKSLEEALALYFEEESIEEYVPVKNIEIGNCLVYA